MFSLYLYCNNLFLSFHFRLLVHRPIGPFSQYSVYLNPDPYYDSCVYDACATLPNVDVICDDISLYAEACTSLGFPPTLLVEFCREFLYFSVLFHICLKRGTELVMLAQLVIISMDTLFEPTFQLKEESKS